MSKNIYDLFDAKEIESITTLIDKLGSSSFDFLKLENEDTKIVIGKNGMSDVVEVSASKAGDPVKASSAAVTPPQEDVVESKTATVEASAVSTPNKEAQEETGVEIVKSPSHGLFYAQSAPGQPPYVEVGKMVKKGDTLGLFEIMKVFSNIESPVDGEVIEIMVENNERIEPGKPLMKIKIK